MGIFDIFKKRKNPTNGQFNKEQPEVALTNKYYKGNNTYLYSLQNGDALHRADIISLSIDGLFIEGYSNLFLCTVKYGNGVNKPEFKVFIELDEKKMKSASTVSYTEFIFKVLLEESRIESLLEKVDDNTNYVGSVREIDGKLSIIIDPFIIDAVKQSDAFKILFSEYRDKQIAALKAERDSLVKDPIPFSNAK